MATPLRPADGIMTLAEMKEFASFPAATQRYIRRSLDIGLHRDDALERWSRDGAEAFIRELGGKVGSAVTKSTTLLVAGPGGGSKLARAEALGTPVLDEVGFIALLQGRGWEGQP